MNTAHFMMKMKLTICFLVFLNEVSAFYFMYLIVHMQLSVIPLCITVALWQ